MIAFNADKLLELRQLKKRPKAVAIVPTSEMFHQVEAHYFPILVNLVEEYDWQMLWGLPVTYVMPDIPGAMLIAFQIADCHPSEFKIIYPDNPKIVKIW